MLCALRHNDKAYYSQGMSGITQQSMHWLECHNDVWEGTAGQFNGMLHNPQRDNL